MEEAAQRRAGLRRASNLPSVCKKKHWKTLGAGCLTQRHVLGVDTLEEVRAQDSHRRKSARERIKTFERDSLPLSRPFAVF